LLPGNRFRGCVNENTARRGEIVLFSFFASSLDFDKLVPVFFTFLFLVQIPGALREHSPLFSLVCVAFSFSRILQQAPKW